MWTFMNIYSNECCKHLEGIRGYQVRKRFGPLIKAGQWDANKREFMSYFCKKWRKRSLFQILLIYRSLRYQDLVSFAQQVHLFSQNAVAALQTSCREAVVLDHVDPKPGTDWLDQGQNFRPPVWRRPFNLLDVTFRDTSPLCPSLTILGVLSEDIDDWDIPIRRGKSGLLLPGNEPNIEMPFSRDPDTIKALIEVPPEPTEKEEESKSKGSSPKNKTPSPENKTPSPSPSVNNNKDMEQKQEEKFKEPMSPQPKPKKYAVYKAMPKVKTMDNCDDFTSIKLRPARPNPIMELETRGIRSNTNDIDEAPFNFQAMLRKTNTNRGSLHREKNNQIKLLDSEAELNGINLSHQPEPEPEYIIENISMDEARICKDPNEFDEASFIVNIPKEEMEDNIPNAKFDENLPKVLGNIDDAEIPPFIELVPGLLRLHGSSEDL